MPQFCEEASGGCLAYIVSGAENSVVCRQFVNIIITAIPTFCLRLGLASSVFMCIYMYNIHVERCILAGMIWTTCVHVHVCNNLMQVQCTCTCTYTIYRAELGVHNVVWMLIIEVIIYMYMYMYMIHAFYGSALSGA